MFKKPNFLSKLFSKETTRERKVQDLLRENLALVPLDIYYIDDPLLGIPPDKRSAYLKKFHDLVEDKDIMKWFEYLVNKQVRVTMQQSKDGEDFQAGAININGIASVRDTFKGLAAKYVKENVQDKNFNKFSIT